MPATRSADPRYYDFDAAFEEAEKATIPFKVMGKVWELPAAAPAAVLLKIQRVMMVLAQMEEGGEVPDDMVIDDELSYENMCRQLAGDAAVDEWLRLKISYPKLQAVSRRLYEIHTGKIDAEEPGKAPGKRPADRKRPAKRASPRKR